MKRSELTLEKFNEMFKVLGSDTLPCEVVASIKNGAEVVEGDSYYIERDWKGLEFHYKYYDVEVLGEVVRFKAINHFRTKGTIRQRCLSEWS